MPPNQVEDVVSSKTLTLRVKPRVIQLGYRAANIGPRQLDEGDTFLVCNYGTREE